MIKLICVIELEMERDVPDIGAEVVKRITMHPHVHDANVLAISASLEGSHAPKPVARAFLGMASPNY